MTMTTDIFDGKTLLITGGTGSFGNAVLKRFLNSNVKEIRIFSRDEKKQDDMRHALQCSKIKYYIGDIRDRQSVDNAMEGVDYVFSAAALKQVPSCEFFPLQAVQTNVLGTNNVIESAIAHGVKRVVVLSTDKAAYPINAMGISKAMMEKVAIARGRSLGDEAKTIIIVNDNNLFDATLQQLTVMADNHLFDPRLMSRILVAQSVDQCREMLDNLKEKYQ